MDTNNAVKKVVILAALAVAAYAAFKLLPPEGPQQLASTPKTEMESSVAAPEAASADMAAPAAALEEGTGTVAAPAEQATVSAGTEEAASGEPSVDRALRDAQATSKMLEENAPKSTLNIEPPSPESITPEETATKE